MGNILSRFWTASPPQLDPIDREQDKKMSAKVDQPGQVAKVYVVTENCICRDGFRESYTHVIGVFNTPELANKAAHELTRKAAQALLKMCYGVPEVKNESYNGLASYKLRDNGKELSVGVHEELVRGSLEGLWEGGKYANVAGICIDTADNGQWSELEADEADEDKDDGEGAKENERG